MLNFSSLQSACAKAGISEVEIYRSISEGSSVSTFNKAVDQNVVYQKAELYIRGVKDGHIASVYVERDDDDEIDNIVSRLSDSTSAIESTDPYFIYGGSDKYPTIEKESHDFDSYTQGDKLALCRKMEDFVKSKSEFVTMTQAGIDVECGTVTIENSNGLSVSRDGKYAVVYCAGIINKDGDTREGYYYDFVKNLSDIDYDKLCERAVKRPLSAIGAKSIPSSTYPVVFENTQFASLVSCFLSMFSGDAVTKKLSLLEGKCGTKVFGDNITVTDDPLLKESYRRVTFDDEGVATFPKTVVENGVLKTFLHSLKTAKMLGAEPTGNGFKTGSGDISTRPANLCFKGTDVSFDDMIAPIENGIYITGMMGQHAGVNPVSGSFNLQASGYKIINGKIADPVTLIVVSGNIVDVLNSVECISNDFEVSGLVACGSVFVKSLSISGQ
ncbi:MAG: TldD/PmbA family protein [Clostridiales bacterium]|nr:TldD/PmbA family protein [Clostridiales bacterium]